VHRTVSIDVNHVTRVEGHGSIVVRASDGTVHKVEWLVPEAPRFFEAMVRGRSYEDIQTIVSRICGICSFAHSFAAVKAIEDAFGIEVTEQTNRLRTLTYYGEQIESHVLHVGYLAAPDFFGVKSVVPLVGTHPDVVRKIIRLHTLGNDWMEMFGGRRTHPVTIQPGGFTRYPTEEMLRTLKGRIQACIPDLEAVAEAVLSAVSPEEGAIPSFARETEYVALVHPDDYPFYEGSIGSSDTPETVDVHEFERVANEYVSPQSTAKWARWHRDSYMVGALARFNLNADRLLPPAKKTAKLFGLEKGCVNPYMNTIAQVVEIAQCLEHGLRLIDEILAKGIEPEKRCHAPREGEGVGCVEAPRGILFHRYSFDGSGICTGGNICIPTGQNHANIQKDFEKLVPEFLDQGEDRLQLHLEMLARAYDPCISCSTH
jgi:coenzyme F420-reducing hydrogenase alpha subunit